MFNPFAKKPAPTRGVLALYADPDSLLNAATRAREHGFEGMDAYTPYAVHGMSEATALGSGSPRSAPTGTRGGSSWS